MEASAMKEPSQIHGLCYHCNSELFGVTIEVAGRYYHNRCFYCCKCRKQLRQDDFRMRDVSREREGVRV